MTRHHRLWHGRLWVVLGVIIGIVFLLSIFLR